jgi:hypothetical protein
MASREMKPAATTGADHRCDHGFNPNETGFDVERLWMRFYFDARFERHGTGHEPPARVKGFLKNIVYRFLPRPLREGITVLARRRDF